MHLPYKAQTHHPNYKFHIKKLLKSKSVRVYRVFWLFKYPLNKCDWIFYLQRKILQNVKLRSTPFTLQLKMWTFGFCFVFLFFFFSYHLRNQPPIKMAWQSKLKSRIFLDHIIDYSSVSYSCCFVQSNGSQYMHIFRLIGIKTSNTAVKNFLSLQIYEAIHLVPNVFAFKNVPFGIVSCLTSICILDHNFLYALRPTRDGMGFAALSNPSFINSLPPLRKLQLKIHKTKQNKQ